MNAEDLSEGVRFLRSLGTVPLFLRGKSKEDLSHTFEMTHR